MSKARQSRAIARGARIYLRGRAMAAGQDLVDQLAAKIHRSSTAYTPEFAEKHGMREWIFMVLAYQWPRETRRGRARARLEQLALPL